MLPGDDEPWRQSRFINFTRKEANCFDWSKNWPFIRSDANFRFACFQEMAGDAAFSAQACAHFCRKFLNALAVINHIYGASGQPLLTQVPAFFLSHWPLDFYFYLIISLSRYFAVCGRVLCSAYCAPAYSVESPLCLRLPQSVWALLESFLSDKILIFDSYLSGRRALLFA